jgi:hypothetical protein
LVIKRCLLFWTSYLAVYTKINYTLFIQPKLIVSEQDEIIAKTLSTLEISDIETIDPKIICGKIYGYTSKVNVTLEVYLIG